MDLIYSMRRKPLKCEPPHFESVSDHEVVRPICTISTCNIIAFSSPTELDDTEGDTWGGHVYVCDLNTPWDTHKVTSTDYPVSALEWDMEGKQLLVATSMGEASVFAQKDYLLNEWTMLYTATFPGEHIIRGAFFHNGRRVVMTDKKPDAPVTDRIQMLRSTPTLKGFGGVATEGACIITATGLIALLTAPGEGSKALVVSDCLRPTRDRIVAASISHKNGSLVIAAICREGPARSCVRCVLAGAGAGAGAGGGAPVLSLKPLHTIYLPAQHQEPVSLTWCHREDTDSLLVAGAGLALWRCSERAHPVHKLLAKGPLQGSTTPGGGPKQGADCFNTLVWQKVAAWTAEGGEPAVCCASSRPAPSAPHAPHALLATPSALHLLARDTHHYLCSRAVITSGGPGLAETASSPPKKPKYGSNATTGSCAKVSCVEMSYFGGVAVVIDTHAQLHVYKLPQPWADIPTPLAVQHATSLLEYALVTGYDCLDVLMTLKHNIIEPVYERLTETFTRQPAPFQQYYFHCWLKMRIALCRLVGGLQSSVSWLTCAQALGAGWAGVALALRPDDKPDDKHALALLAALDDAHAADHDKTLLALEAKPDAVTDAFALQPLRLELQRAVDIGLTALLSLCYQHQHQHQMHSHGYELWADGSAVSLLRRLCATARATRTAPDALSRALARLATCATPKPDLIEECLSLTSQWAGARVWEALPLCAVSVPHSRQWPLYLEYGVEPEALRFTPEPPPYAQCETTPSTTMDSIRYMYLGGGSRPARWRQCSRCGSRALPAPQPARHPVQRAYDSRFLAQCRCGGKWTLFSNI